MHHSVLALGCAATTLAGCVWYVPALATVRAGEDRPASRRCAAAAVLTAWGTLIAVAVSLALTSSWLAPLTAAGAGLALASALRVRAALVARAERAPWVDILPTVARPPQRAFAAWTVTGLSTGLVLSVVVMLAAQSTPVAPRITLALLTGASATAAFLLLAAARLPRGAQHRA
ncbi:hypothetical protein SRB5_52200 [Streptomyces sp. RB5]|uniref:Uncharacterized protein n=1 Tax=Streptomyces smaragdinus TaxID=2585196 RepID=A0A7K0CP26_9ACTN|nr:hypothetical protein [Streptomyces smaragdinus]MQY15043.1 hypothetical protein [Streptomyces smaragdinus]